MCFNTNNSIDTLVIQRLNKFIIKKIKYKSNVIPAHNLEAIKVLNLIQTDS